MDFGRNVINFGVDMSSSVHAENKKKDILILGEGPTQGLDDTTLTAEKKNSIGFIEHNKKFCLSLACSIMEQIVIYLLMALKFIHLKQKTLKLMQFYYV